MEPNNFCSYKTDVVRELYDMLKGLCPLRRPINDPFFSEGYKVCNVFLRTGITVKDDEDLCHRVITEFQCNALDCDQVFHNLADYEIHYNGSHRYTCEECKITRPNARLLEIHIQETHDSFFNISSQKQPMFQCYVTECNEKFPSPQDRSSHCTTIHEFPENFLFGEEGLRTVEMQSKGTERRDVTPIPEDAMEITDERTAQCGGTQRD